MLFTSLEFLFLFLPCVLLLHLLLPRRAKNVWLLFSGLFFYAWGEPTFLPVMLCSILANYLFALCLARYRRKWLLFLSVLANLTLLFFFKYANFFTKILGAWLPSLPKTAIPLPIGISFFTFQAMSYVIDVYRGASAQKNPLDLGLYISLFPQLIAGPIVRYTDVSRELREREVSWEGICYGAVRFLRGFNKKVLLANALSAVADAAFIGEGISMPLAWLGALAYALQIYFDFSGYSEMAIGLGAMLGFTFPENFNDPYASVSVSEFWRRWHMTLGTWFRDYLYFPLGGSRVKGKGRLVFNLAVVWLCTGLWHGADWSFLLWGAWYGLIIIAEKLFGLPERLKSGGARFAYRLFTLLSVLLGWVLFRAESLFAAGQYFASMVGLGGGYGEAGFYLSEYFLILAVALVASTPLLKRLKERMLQARPQWRTALGALGVLSQVVLFCIGVSFLVMDAHDPFIYFNF